MTARLGDRIRDASGKMRTLFKMRDAAQWLATLSPRDRDECVREFVAILADEVDESVLHELVHAIEERKVDDATH